MSAHGTLAAPLVHDDAARTARCAMGESLLLRFLVQRGIIHQSLLRLIDVERVGSGTTLSLVDWLVQRGHVSEEALISVLAACLQLQTSDLAPFALDPLSTTHAPSGPDHTAITNPKPRHLRLVSSTKK